MSLILLADFKSFIHMDENFDDTELQNIIDGVEASVATHLGYDMEEQTNDVEYYDGDRSNTVLLDNGMVTAVNSVKVDEDYDFTYGETLTFEEDYIWYSNGIIQLITGGYFPRRQKYIEVDYDHGYTSGTLPNDLTLALKKLMANDYHRSLGIMEIEAESTYKIFSDKETWDIVDRYARLQV